MSRSKAQKEYLDEEDDETESIQAVKGPPTPAVKPKRVLTEKQKANLEKGRQKINEIRETVKQYEKEKTIKKEVEMEDMIKASFPQKIEDRLKQSLDQHLEERVNELISKKSLPSKKKVKKVIYEDETDDEEEEVVVVKRRRAYKPVEPKAVVEVQKPTPTKAPEQPLKPTILFYG